MSKKRKTQHRDNSKQMTPIGVWMTDSDSIICPGYTSLDQNPEIMTACKKIAELIGSLTIHLMANTERGDQRIINELSRKIDIEPEMHMTRSTWIQGIVMNLLLYGKGNSIVIPHTYQGQLVNLEPIAASRVSFNPIGYRDYKVLVDGKARDPENLLHFVFNPDKTYLWKGKGVTTNLRDIALNLKQAAATEKGFMESKWKPSIIVKVDALVDEFSSPDGRRRLLEEYVKSSEVGEPWLIPADQFQVEQVKPLSLKDLAIDSTVELDKRTVASILGVPPFLLGVGEYNKEAWNNFIQSTIKTLALSIQQEMTKKLIISQKMYLRFNVLSLMDWDIETIYKVFGGLSDKGIVTGNEVRDRLGMEQIDGLDELRILENYIPSDMIGNQKKLIQGGNEDG
ncbi:MAG: phage portal protein [Clostridiales bacterium]|nr:phage portal protein [Clostridiales bacterium]MBQ1572696.1 phage portal protein [Clostridiales bacterium]